MCASWLCPVLAALFLFVVRFGAELGHFRYKSFFNDAADIMDPHTTDLKVDIRYLIRNGVKSFDTGIL